MKRDNGATFQDDPVFLANYSDGLSDLPLDRMIAHFQDSDAIASFAAVQSWHSFHGVQTDDKNYVTSLAALRGSEFLINGGYFVLRREIFDFIERGDELVEAPFQRLIEQRRLLSYRHAGFWRAMDTLKDKIAFDRTYAAGDAPWKLWNR